MPGPTPNPNARRKNKGSQFVELPPHGWAEAPKLPTREKGKGWKTATRAAWAAWWASPMASQWDEADVSTLVLAAIAYDEGMRGSLDHAREFRLLADRVGLHSLSRVRHRWFLPSRDAADESDSTVVKLELVSGGKG